MNNLSKGTGKTAFELNSLGWKITEIEPHTFRIEHAWHCPFGGIVKRGMTLKEVITFINSEITRIKEEEDHLNDILDR